MTMLPIRDVSLFVKIVGNGPPLLLMHGGPGLDHTTLTSLAPLADQYTLIFYDHRANGRSSGDVESMTWENLTADAEAIRNTLGFDQWSVLGHSFGGQVALEYALRYGERLTRLILLDTFADANLPRVSAPEILRKRGYSEAAIVAVTRFFSGNVKVDEVKSTVMKFMKAYFYKFRVWDLPAALMHALRLKIRPDTIVFGFGKLLKEWSVIDRLDEIEVPTMVMGGRFDFLFPPEHLAILADRLPNARLEIIEAAGHNPQMERSDDVVGILRRFLSGRASVSYAELR